ISSNAIGTRQTAFAANSQSSMEPIRPLKSSMRPLSRFASTASNLTRSDSRSCSRFLTSSGGVAGQAPAELLLQIGFYLFVEAASAYNPRVSEPLNLRIDASTRYCAVFGFPIRHSASPAMQNAGIEALGL